MANHIISVAFSASLSIMLRVCVMGHSLVPTPIPLSIPSVQLDIILHPGVSISSLTSRLNDIDFWSRRYDQYYSVYRR